MLFDGLEQADGICQRFIIARGTSIFTQPVDGEPQSIKMCIRDRPGNYRNHLFNLFRELVSGIFHNLANSVECAFTYLSTILDVYKRQNLKWFNKYL